jgi:hypothetical protein
MIERWQHGPVDLAAEHFELSYSGKGETKTETAVVVAAIGPPAGGLLNVSILIDRNRTNADMIVAVEREIDFYFLELNEPDPWVYAQYHCGTASNAYGPVHWSFVQAEDTHVMKGEYDLDGPVVSEPTDAASVDLTSSDTTIGRIYERDIDLFLAEEFKVSPAFATGLLTHRLRAEAGVKEGTYADFAIMLIRVAPFTIGAFDDHAWASVRAAFKACVRLIRFYRQHQAALDEAASLSLRELEPPHFSAASPA